jgi:shikimate-5-dehydrogenase/3-dehydroquinate dehydratase type I
MLMRNCHGRHLLTLLVNCLVFTIASGFLSLRRRVVPSSLVKGVRRQQKDAARVVSVSSRGCADSRLKAAAASHNMFEDYTGPIVLLGCSGPGNELSRLAAFLSTQVVAVSNAAAAADQTTSSRIVPLTPIGGSAAGAATATATATTTATAVSSSTAAAAAATTLPMLADDLLAAMAQRELYTWPDIVLLDLSFFNDTVWTESHDVRRVARALYETYQSLVIYVHTDASRAVLGEAKKLDWDDQVFVPYSDYELCILDEGDDDDDDDALTDDWAHIEWELVRLLARARLPRAAVGDNNDDSLRPSIANPQLVLGGPNTFFLSLSFNDLALVEPFVPSMCLDVDAMEVRADLLSCRDSRFDLLYSMQLLRCYCRPHVVRVAGLPLPLGLTIRQREQIMEDVMPIVYTVRTQNQAGTYPDDEAGIAKMFDLLQWGLRGGVEVLDVESAWDAAKTNALLEKARERYASFILGSHHVVGTVISTEEAVDLFVQCALDGRAHGAKVVLTIDDENKDRMAYEAALIASELAASNGEPVIPNISLILGEIGQFSRIINLPFTPVTHESLPFPAAPGQLSASEIMTTRLLTKIFTPKKYAILGHNIAYSVSPQMHGAAFSATRLPHEYIRVDVATVDEFIDSDFFKSDDFGGASVTVPHKQAIMAHVDILSPAAKAIGSVNTLIAESEYDEDEDEFTRVIYGDNTDWKGIYNPLQRLLGTSVNPVSDFALIVGAGGTARAAAYVATRLGLQPIYYNRTPSKADELASSFGGTVVTSLEQSSEPTSLGSMLGQDSEKTIRVVISTVPAASDFVFPDWLIAAAERKPIVFDVNYKPYSTKLLLQAEAAGCPVVRGSEMLWEQGVGQFEFWTKRTAPYSVMKQVVLQNCQESVDNNVPTAALNPASALE